MRIAVTVAMDSKGKWECLSTPDTPIQEQKDALKEMKANEKSGKFVKAVLLASSGPGKRYKFKLAKKSAAKTLDDVKA